jgi:hypothetical protein
MFFPSSLSLFAVPTQVGQEKHPDGTTPWRNATTSVSMTKISTLQAYARSLSTVEMRYTAQNIAAPTETILTEAKNLIFATRTLEVAPQGP